MAAAETLKVGATGPRVRQLQADLAALGLFLGDVDGNFGETTRLAVVNFQAHAGLVDQGELNQATEIVLEEQLSLLRGALNCLGYLQGGDLALAQAISQLQSEHDVPKTGQLDDKSREALRQQIETLQSKLYFLGYYKGFVDGNYNPFVTTAIRAFQLAYHLVTNGIRDVDTNLALIQNAVIAPPDFEHPASAEHRDMVADLQRKLHCCGFYAGRQDGEYGQATLDGLMAFQRHHKLPRRDGVCDDHTWWKLNQEAGTLFDEAFQWELDALDEEGTKVIPDMADARPASEAAVLRRAHRNQLLGLALSGGGIRSATFNLGVLQGLSEFRLLNEFHFLSTVSGGGYIGSWLSKWIHEENGDVGKVQAQLAIRNRDGPRNSEPDQVKFLRQHSNYLTPKVGVLGADTWAVIATYLRNVMLNMTILGALLTAIMLVPRILNWLVHQYYQATPAQSLVQTHAQALFQTLVQAEYTAHYAFWFGFIAMVSFLIAVFFISLNISLRPHPNNQKTWFYCQRQGCVLQRVVVPLMLSGFFGSIWLWFERVAVLSSLTYWLYCALIPAIYLIVWAAAWLLGQRANIKNQARSESHASFVRQIAPHVLFSVLALLLGVSLIVLVLNKISGTAEKYVTVKHVSNLTTFGMPMALAIFGITMVLLVGLLGREYSDRSREWWSRMGGWTIIFTSAWVVLFVISLYGPPLFSALHHQVGVWASSTLTLGWVVATLGGVLFGKSDHSGPATKSKVFDRIVALAPLVFVVGILLLVSILLQAALTDTAVIDSKQPALKDYFDRAFTASEGTSLRSLLCTFAGCVLIGGVLAWRVDINKFSLYMMYRNRLVRCYLGASNPKREPHAFTGFDAADDPHLTEMLWQKSASGSSATLRLQKPFHLINTALNLVKGKELAWQERKAASFVFSPGYSGFETPSRSGHLQTASSNDLARGCFRPTREYGAGKQESIVRGAIVGGVRSKVEAFADEEEGVKLGQALAISGAAASPNMGYHSNPALSFLMTAFNVRLGRWCSNPRQTSWREASPRFGLRWLISELLGLTNADSQYVYLSDGGHFENLGIYELVRRRCALIVVIDASADGDATFNDLGGAVRKCFTDFGIEIDIRVNDIKLDPATRLSKNHSAIGTINYDLVDADADPGILLYIKPSLTGNEPTDILNYRDRDKTFPHQSTADQWFDETQFESYRKLGYHISSSILSELCGELDKKMAGSGDRRATLIKLLRQKLKQAQNQERVSEEQMLIHELKGKLSSAWQSPAAGKLSGGKWNI